VRPLSKEAFEAEVFESISDATEWCRLDALNNDAVFEICSKGRVGWRHVYSWYRSDWRSNRLMPHIGRS
jgi:hypothetical protein